MGYRVLAEATMVVHFLFIAFVVLGGFLAWRWPAALWLHLAAAAWGLCIVVFALNCPLTWVEDWARERAGQSGLARGFIDTYLTGVMYPERYLNEVRLLIAVVVAVSYAGVVIRWRRRG
ncbi:DUF2784 domain-containing protein [Actinoplanes xinjiangensis]|jgi:hypothetical protein|uniref:Uncharacterized protein DUF2784 n=1 Tax=Actinoplanes xinjiangensis TaxID=512350 RepID=A0A316FIN4_9ACTN|nr:DUF2784 domain-containing protein [Actinoplanes xinjiangensis]PWK48778.1 uncharacterized protein DUF2784 [Actinoplanes xinjiangensis]GIF38485.1 hypothetical protein Axi01nite_27960 [Actinoplanes xinjiangensis]